MIYVNGYGFPIWRGGPMLFADLMGVGMIHDKVAEFHRAFGERWRPAPLLAELARTGGTFRAYDRGRRA